MDEDTAEILVRIDKIPEYLPLWRLNLLKCISFVDRIERTTWQLRVWIDENGIWCMIGTDYAYDWIDIMLEVCLRVRTHQAERWREVGEKKRESRSFRKGAQHKLFVASRQEILDDSNRLLVRNGVELSVRLWYDDPIPHYPTRDTSPFLLFAQSDAGVHRSVICKIKMFSDWCPGEKKLFLVERGNDLQSYFHIVLYLEEGQINLSVASGYESRGVLMESVWIELPRGIESCWDGKHFLQFEVKSEYLPIIQLRKLTKNANKYLPKNQLTICFQFTDFYNYARCYANDIAQGTTLLNHKRLANRFVQTRRDRDGTSSNDESGGASSNAGVASVDSLADDLSTLFEKGTCSDFTLRVGTETIPVHKGVLCARSPVFEAMLTSPMLESTENAVTVPDFSPAVVRHLVKFLYSGLVADLDHSTALELYSAADKYCVLPLRARCTRVLASGLSVSNVCGVLSLSERRSDEDLKKKVLEFLVDNDEEVYQSSEWSVFMKEQPHLALEVTHNVNLKRFGE